MLTATDISKRIVQTDAAICQATGMQSEQLASLKWEHAFYYLDYVLPDLPEAQTRISKQGFFWGWWSVTYYRRSKQWLNYVNRQLMEDSTSSFCRFQRQQLRATPLTEQLYRLINTHKQSNYVKRGIH